MRKSESADCRLIINKMPERFDLKHQRGLMTIGLFLVVGLVLYVYLIDIFVLAVVLMAAWYLYDLIQDYTKEFVDSSGKYVFITGCDSGFGLASAKAIRDLGFHVIAGCYDDKSVGAQELKARPWVQKVEVVSLDVTNEASVMSVATQVKDICRDQGLWAVINNAGVNSCGPVELVSMEMYHRTAEINMFGAIRVIKSVLPAIRQAQGRIVNVTSERGFNPWGGNSPYCVTKFGLEAFSACLRTEMQPFNVNVITIAPGQFGGATAIADKKLVEDLIDKLLLCHSKLSLEDQRNAYKKEDVEGIADAIEMCVQKSCHSPDPVLKAYIDSVHNSNPRDCYLVHGSKKQYLDQYIIMARIRPFIPLCIVQWVEKAVSIFG